MVLLIHFSRKSDSRITNVRLSVCLKSDQISYHSDLSVDHWAYWPLSLLTIEPIDHQAYQPSSLATTKLIDPQAYWPSSLSTIRPIDHRAYRPLSLLTIEPIAHQAYWPSSPLTIKPINQWSSFATFEPFIGNTYNWKSGQFSFWTFCPCCTNVWL